MRHDDVVLDGETLRLRCIDAVEDEGARFGALARDLERSARLDGTVPWIPAWSVRDLGGHLGTVHRWTVHILRAGHTGPPSREFRQAPPAEGLLDWYCDGVVTLVGTLRETPPAAPAWHMSPAAEKVAASWARRQAHELTVHRMDLEIAAGRPRAPLDPALAEDGVDEVLGTVLPRWAATEPLASASATIAVTSRASGRRWRVQMDHGAVSVDRHGHGSVDAAVEGDPADLLLHLWGRPADGIVVTGNRGVEQLLRGR